jgi:helicase
MRSSPYLTRSPAQEEILSSGLLTTGFSCVLQMPTGSGKTWLAEQAIAEVLSGGSRAVYLTPLRALATELLERWQPRFGQVQVGAFTGDHTGKAYPVPFRDARLLIMTPERLDLCTRSWRSHWEWLPEVDLVVADEFHLLGDANRGGRMEGALSRVQRLNPFVRVLGLSATLGNLGELADWLDGLEYRSTWRPIPLEWRVLRYRRATDKPALLADEVARTVRSGGRSLVFVQSRRRAEEVSRYLSGTGLASAHHHAGLAHGDRRSVEEAFRSGTSNVLVATATLEMGLNLPVRQVVLYDLQGFDGGLFRPLSTTSVWQRAGRAGRPGLDDAGEVVLLAAAWDRDADRYQLGDFEPVRSALNDPRVLAEQIVVEVASGLCRTESQVRAALDQSLAARQGRLPPVTRYVHEMREAGMLVECRDEATPSSAPKLKATRLGHIATRHLLTPGTVLLLQRVTATGRPVTFFDLLVLAASTEDCEPLLPVDYEDLETMASRLAEQRSFLLANQAEPLPDVLSVKGRRLLTSLKIALVLRDWTERGDAVAVADEHDCYPFEVLRLREAAVRLLTAMASVVGGGNEGTEPVHADTEDIAIREKVGALKDMVEKGLNERAITLTRIEGIGPTLAHRLLSAGIEDVEDLALADPHDLSEIRGISARRARLWIDAAGVHAKSGGAYRYREHGPFVRVSPPDWPADIDPYRLRRALDLELARSTPQRYEVTGGLEPHIVCIEGENLSCDCVDATRGHTCKHVLAVRMGRGDYQVRALAAKLGHLSTSGTLDLFDLWYAGGQLPNKGVIRERQPSYPDNASGGDPSSDLCSCDDLRVKIPA